VRPWGPKKTLCAKVTRHVLGISALELTLAGNELCPVFLKRVGDIFEEDEPQHDVACTPAASMLLRSLSAVSQSLASKPHMAADLAVDDCGLAGHGAGLSGRVCNPGSFSTQC